MSGLANFKHVINNNFAHDSVGAQPTGAAALDVPAMARALGHGQGQGRARIGQVRVWTGLAGRCPGCLKALRASIFIESVFSRLCSACGLAGTLEHTDFIPDNNIKMKETYFFVLLNEYSFFLSDKIHLDLFYKLCATWWGPF